MHTTLYNLLYLTFLVAVPVTYDGWCRSRNGSIDTHILEATDENSLEKCQAKCYDNEECVAFSYETPTHHKKYNCNRYKGGPYTAGSGRPNTKCYILEQGMFISFYTYTNEYKFIDNKKMKTVRL